MKKSINTNDKYIKYPILLEVKNQLLLSNHSVNTIKNYVAGIFRFFEYHSDINPDKLTEEHFREYLFYLNSTDLNKKTINCNNAYIRFYFCVILNVPLNLHRVPKCRTRSKEIDYLTDDAIISLLDVSAFDSRIDCIIKLGLACGLRINEIVSLKVTDIDISNLRIFIHQSKRGKSRHIPIDNTVLLALKRYSREYHLKKDDYLFTFRNKRKTSNKTIRLYFYEYRDLAGIPDTITFHSLRHTFAVNYLKAGGELIYLKHLMGHDSITSTARYIHIASNQVPKITSYIDTLVGSHIHG